jgi:hypothetical protein
MASHLLPLRNNKVIDLKTGIVRDRELNESFDYELNVNYVLNTDVADTYFRSLISNDNNSSDDHNEIKKFQMYMGSLLTDDRHADDRNILVIEGSGGNGKTTLMRFINAILTDILYLRTDLGATSDTNISGLVNELKYKKRKILHHPENEDNYLNTWLIKSILADEMGVGYAPKIIIETTMTIIKPTSPLYQRCHFIHFPNKFKFCEENTNYISALQFNGLDEIFSWMVQGAIKFYQNGSKI